MSLITMCVVLVTAVVVASVTLYLLHLALHDCIR